MTTRQRQHENNVRPLHGSSDPASDDLDAARHAAEAFARAGQDAIERALSGDSEAFLRDNRQQGGE